MVLHRFMITMSVATCLIGLLPKEASACDWRKPWHCASQAINETTNDLRQKALNTLAHESKTLQNVAVHELQEAERVANQIKNSPITKQSIKVVKEVANNTTAFLQTCATINAQSATFDIARSMYAGNDVKAATMNEGKVMESRIDGCANLFVKAVKPVCHKLIYQGLNTAKYVACGVLYDAVFTSVCNATLHAFAGPKSIEYCDAVVAAGNATTYAGMTSEGLGLIKGIAGPAALSCMALESTDVVTEQINTAVANAACSLLPDNVSIRDSMYNVAWGLR